MGWWKKELGRIILGAAGGLGVLLPYCFGLESLRVLQVGQSKRTFSINFGQYDGIREGDVARFYARPDRKIQKKAAFLGVGVAVKVFPFFSYWHMDKPKTQNQELLALDRNLVLFKIGDYVSTKRKQDLRRRMVVLAHQKKGGSYQLGDVADNEGKERPLSLNKSDAAFAPGPENPYRPRAGTRPDSARVVDVGKWDIVSKKPQESKEGELAVEIPAEESESDVEAIAADGSEIPKLEKEIPEVLTAKTVKRGPTRDEWEQQKLEGDLDKQIDIYFENEEDGPFDYFTFYKAQEKEEPDGIFSKKGTIYNLADERQEKQRLRRLTYLKTLSVIKREGITWSDDMSDGELRRFVVNKGLAKERARQEEAYDSLVSNELMGLYGVSLMDHSSATAAVPSDRPYLLTFAYEYYGMRISEKWRRFTLKGIFKTGKDVYFVKGTNFTSSETSFLVGLSLYPFRLPPEMRIPIFYVGAGLGLGQGDLTGTIVGLGAGTKYYNIITLPGIWTGLKYRWNDYLGFHGELMMSSQMFLATQESNISGLPEDFNTLDLKLGIGVNIYF